LGATTSDELYELLEVFERQLRWLADRRQHQFLDTAGNVLEGKCGGPPTCIRCGMLRRADRIADVLAGGQIEIYLGETTVGGKPASVGLVAERPHDRPSTTLL
jgi:hypothetical protein